MKRKRNPGGIRRLGRRSRIARRAIGLRLLGRFRGDADMGRQAKLAGSVASQKVRFALAPRAPSIHDPESAFEFCCDAQIAHGQIICRPAINLWSPPLFWFGAL